TKLIQCAGHLGCDQRQMLARGALDPLPQSQRVLRRATTCGQVASDNQRPYRFAVGRERFVDSNLRVVELPRSGGRLCNLAVEMCNVGLMVLAGLALEAPGAVDRLGPLALHLKNPQQCTQRIEAALGLSA